MYDSVRDFHLERYDSEFQLAPCHHIFVTHLGDQLRTLVAVFSWRLSIGPFLNVRMRRIPTQEITDRVYDCDKLMQKGDR